MTMCKKDDNPAHQKSRIFIASKRLDLSLGIYLTLMKSFIKRFITEYITNVRLIIS